MPNQYMKTAVITFRKDLHWDIQPVLLFIENEYSFYYTVGSYFCLARVILATDFLIGIPNHMSHLEILTRWQFLTTDFDVGHIFGVNSTRSVTLVAFSALTAAQSLLYIRYFVHISGYWIASTCPSNCEIVICLSVHLHWCTSICMHIRIYSCIYPYIWINTYRCIYLSIYQNNMAVKRKFNCSHKEK